MSFQEKYKLLPCPFCGDEAYLYEGKYYNVLGCETIRCHGNWTYSRMYDTKEEAIEAWNTRAEPTCYAKPYKRDGDTDYFDCTECECGEINDVSAKYCNRCGRAIKVVY